MKKGTDDSRRKRDDRDGEGQQHKLKSFVDAMMIIRLWWYGWKVQPHGAAEGFKWSPGPSQGNQVERVLCVCVM